MQADDGQDAPQVTAALPCVDIMVDGLVACVTCATFGL
jgi:hypothetical protein